MRIRPHRKTSARNKGRGIMTPGDENRMARLTSEWLLRTLTQNAGPTSQQRPATLSNTMCPR